MSILSATCKYGIRAAIYLALNEGDKKIINIKKISNDLDIPTPFLGKILQELVKHDILVSTKGPHGGFSLARSPKNITMLEIIHVIDGDIFDECLIGLRSCNMKSNKGISCPTNKKFKPISDQMYEFFNNETIEDLKEEVALAGGTVGI